MIILTLSYDKVMVMNNFRLQLF